MLTDLMARQLKITLSVLWNSFHKVRLEKKKYLVRNHPTPPPAAGRGGGGEMKRQNKPTDTRNQNYDDLPNYLLGQGR